VISRAARIAVLACALLLASSTFAVAAGAAETSVGGSAPSLGTPGTVVRPAVAIAGDPSGTGYWLASADGGVFTFGSARFAGAAAGTPLSAPIIDIAPTPSGGGYWLAGADGSVLPFGDAGSFGSLAGGPLPNPVVALTAAPDGGGYWMLTAEGGVFTFGSAGFFGSLPGAGVKARAVDLLARPQGDGYWIVDDRGGVHPFGAAPGVGSLPTVNVQPAGKVVSGAATPTGGGYWIASLAGGVYAFGDATSYPVAPLPAGQHVVGIAAAPAGAGYWVAASDGLVPALPGDQGDHVRAIQDRLTKLGYWMGPIDGRTGSLMSQAVMAFQKYMGLARTGVADQPTVDALTVAVPAVARTTGGSMVEIDKARQIIFVVRDGKTVAVFNSSTGTNVPFRERVAGGRIATGNAVTPVGRFTITRELPNGWRTSDLGQLWRPKYFTSTGIAVHGATSVPAYPASHGCARVSVPAMNFIWDANLMPKGIGVWVY
jgi:peptidoglycan hydrolase-like protein with peptidoglycan-binding domain